MPARSHRLRSRHGVSTTEYMLLLSVVVIGIVAAAWVIVPGFESGVGNLASDVKTLLTGSEGASGGGSTQEGECPFVFDSRTGRWHDPSNGYIFVSFADATQGGC